MPVRSRKGLLSMGSLSLWRYFFCRLFQRDLAKMFTQMTCSLVMSNFTLSELLHHLCMLNIFCSFEVLSVLLKNLRPHEAQCVYFHP